MIVVDELKFDEVKTKNFKQVMDNLKVEKGLVILAENDANTVLSARNLASIDTTLTSQINVYDIMKAGHYCSYKRLPQQRLRRCTHNGRYQSIMT